MFIFIYSDPFAADEEIARIHDVYLAAIQPPCACCGNRCSSQLEGVEDNNGIPWAYCSACDPALDEPGSLRCPCRARHRAVAH